MSDKTIDDILIGSLDEALLIVNDLNTQLTARDVEIERLKKKLHDKTVEILDLKNSDFACVEDASQSFAQEIGDV